MSKLCLSLALASPRTRRRRHLPTCQAGGLEGPRPQRTAAQLGITDKLRGVAGLGYVADFCK